MSDGRERTWGVTPVPERLRTLSFGDVALLWGNLGVSLLVLVAGALLGPALGLERALLAIAVGAILGNALLGLAGLIGAERRVPAMVLLRAPLGERGSYAPTALNVLQNVGWATFELIVIAAAASALADRLVGLDVRWIWVLLFGAASGALALLGPISLVRRYLRRFAVWVVVASILYLTWWGLDRADTAALWRGDGDGSLTFWQGVDLTIAMAASWLPLAADYTRFARSGRAAFWGTAVGYFVPHVWLYALGALLLLSQGIGAIGDLTGLLVAIAAGGVGSALALVALTVDEIDEPFANVYSAAVSLQNVFPSASQRLLIVGVSVTATLGALVVDLMRYQTFLFFLGSAFVPLFGVLAADYVLGVARDVAVRWSGLAAWLGGFAAYQWLQPTGPAWWLDVVGATPEAGSLTLGASLPSFLVAFALYAAFRSAVALRPALSR